MGRVPSLDAVAGPDLNLHPGFLTALSISGQPRLGHSRPSGLRVKSPFIPLYHPVFTCYDAPASFLGSLSLPFHIPLALLVRTLLQTLQRRPTFVPIRFILDQICGLQGAHAHALRHSPEVDTCVKRRRCNHGTFLAALFLYG